MVRTLAVYGCLFGLLGCSSSGAGACKSNDAYQCFQSLSSEITACGHPFASPGKFDATGTVCSFSDGTTVEFPTNAFMTSPSDSNVTWSFSVKKNGQVCMQFEVKNAGTFTSPVVTKTLQTSRGAYQEVQAMTASTIKFTYTCPDGMSFDDAELRTCKTTAPHIGFVYSRVNAIMDVRIGTSDSPPGVEIFKCTQF